MKFLCQAFAIFIMLQLVSARFIYSNICKYRGWQMTVGQTRTDCHSIVTCNPGGVISERPSCPIYSCGRTVSRGYKKFDDSKPYPECCGGTICDEYYKVYSNFPKKGFSYWSTS